MTSPRRRSLPSFATACVAIGGSLLLAACGSETAAPVSELGSLADQPPAAVRIDIERSRFAPAELTVEAGTELIFVNLDVADHTVTARDGASSAFDSGLFGQDETFTIVFDEAGSYPYFCEIHPTMRGAVVVE